MIREQEGKGLILEQIRILITTFLLFKMKLNVLIAITLAMKNLNAGAKSSQNNVFLQVPKY